jgi:chromosome segregation ATPase
MSEFKVIETQEEFDKAIKSRLAQKDRELAEQYKEYLSPEQAEELKADLKKQLDEANDLVAKAKETLAEKDKTVSELEARATKAESDLLKQKGAHANKLPLELAGRLIGTTEEELTKDAESLAALLKPTSTPPLRTSEGGIGGNNTNNGAQYMGLLASLNEQMNK